MKSTLLATAAAVGLLAVPHAAFASPPDRGFVEANIGFGWTDEDSFDGNWRPFDDPFDFGAKTRWLFPLSERVHIQGDLFAERLNSVFHGGEGGFPQEDSSLLGGTVHVIHPMDNGRVGVAGSLYSLDAVGPFVGKGAHANVDYGLVALEGQYFLDRWTFFGQGGWFGDVAGCDGREGCVHDGVFFRANASYFFTPNSALTFDGNLLWGDDEVFGDVSGGTARLEGEYKFTDSCFSGFVGLSYEHEEVDVALGSAGEDTTTLDLGIRIYLDQSSLMDHSQKGPSMNTPTFHHMLTSEGTLQIQAFEENF